jgi:hypothetical protein
MEELVMPILIGLGSGAVSGFVQFWTKLKDENNDGVVDIKDFSAVKFGKTVLISSVSAGYFAGTGIPMEPLLLGFVSVGSEKIIGVAIKFLKQIWNKFMYDLNE